MLGAMDPSPDRRHGRHLTLPQIGASGQRRLGDAHVLIVGLGGLGSPAALYLAAAGVGRLTLADFDTVELSNLQRQIAHTTDRVGQSKTESARTACLAIDPELRVESVEHGLDEEDLAELVPRCSAVLDCSDNFPTRFAVNAACVAAGVPLVSGAAIRFDGQVTVIDPRVAEAPCYRCLHAADGTEGAESCAEAGILGPVVGLIGCVQAIETVKLLCGIGESLAGRLVLFDGLGMRWEEIRLVRRPDCPVCSSRGSDHSWSDPG